MRIDRHWPSGGRGDHPETKGPGESVILNPQKLVVTRLDGPDDANPAEQQNPTWPDIERAIRRLDGDGCSMVSLGIGPPPVPHMAIGGGENGKYIVYATEDNQKFLTLVNPGAPAGKCLLVAGGQRGEYDLRICVDLSAALEAAREYAESGQLATTLTWESKG
jgi:hypothetical protein